MAIVRLTIQDIADRLGLSKFSVSRALSGKPGVSEATRGLVVRTAHAMGYKVGPEAGRESGQILFVRQEIDPVSSELWLNVQHGAEAEAERLGFSIVPRHARYLSENGAFPPAVVGLILAVPRPSDITEIAARTKLPIVCAGYVGALERFDQVVASDWESGVAVGRMLTGLGHRRMTFLHGSPTPLGRAERFRGFRDGIMETAETRVSDLVFDEREGVQKALFAHLRAGERPTALFCAHDGLAVSLVTELLRMGVRIPDDVSIVGFNDFASATSISPSLTTLRTPQADMGAAMVRCVTDRLANGDGVNRAPVRISLAPELVQRQSTGPVSQWTWESVLRAGATVGAVNIAHPAIQI